MGSTPRMPSIAWHGSAHGLILHAGAASPRRDSLDMISTAKSTFTFAQIAIATSLRPRPPTRTLRPRSSKRARGSTHCGSARFLSCTYRRSHTLAKPYEFAGAERSRSQSVANLFLSGRTRLRRGQQQGYLIATEKARPGTRWYTSITLSSLHRPRECRQRRKRDSARGLGLIGRNNWNVGKGLAGLRTPSRSSY